MCRRGGDPREPDSHTSAVHQVAHFKRCFRNDSRCELVGCICWEEMSAKQISFSGSLNMVAVKPCFRNDFGYMIDWRECQMNKLVSLDNLKMTFLDDN